MKLKHLAIAVAALGLFTIGMWFVRQQGKSYTVDPIIGTALVSGDTLNAARSIELFDGADVASVTLMLQGNQWMIEEYYRLPIEFTRLRRLVTELGELKVIRAVTENPERMAALDLGDELIVFRDLDGLELGRVAFGRPGETGGVFAKTSQSPKALLVDRSPALEFYPLAWADKTPLGLEVGGLKTVTLKYLNGYQIELTRDDATNHYSAATSLPEGQALDQEQVRRAIDAMLDPRVDSATAIDDPAVEEAMVYAHEITLVYDSGKEVVYRVGRRPEQILLPEVFEEGPEPSDEGVGENEPETKPAGDAYLVMTGIGPAIDSIAYKLSSSTFKQFPIEWDILVETQTDDTP
ncbi:MAG: DUF4340 domain-containing protein [Opitutales bacterium]|nr:DUF4340 domain-containing protein [Opitutales bacterium]NRA26098.1 DUF4340 domain-containing protein [Opitutales bacterium]